MYKIYYFNRLPRLTTASRPQREYQHVSLGATSWRTSKRFETPQETFIQPDRTIEG